MSRPMLILRSMVVGASLPLLGLFATADAAEPVRKGNDSCLARGCHGTVGTADPLKNNYYFKGGEATTWRTYDPHARAFDVLLTERSKRIAKYLAKDLQSKPAHEAKLCLDCHSVQGVPSAEEKQHGNPFAAGVDCESCHGNSSEWVEPHLKKDWVGTSEAAQKLGYRPLLDLSARAKLCVSCHVGDETKQVNHDLIAAGHPRLIFEFDSYMHSLPRHWREPHEKPDAKTSAKDFHAKAWAIGQVALTDANLSLLKSRASAASKESAPWPEFTEYDCFSCHHDLASPSWRQNDRGRTSPGSLPWGSLFVGTTSSLTKASNPSIELSDSLKALRAEMIKRQPSAAAVEKLATDAGASLGSLKVKSGEMVDLANPLFRFDSNRIESLLRVYLDPDSPVTNWDEACARMLAAEALSRSWVDLNGKAVDPAIDQQIKALRISLEFPKQFDSPKAFRPVGSK